MSEKVVDDQQTPSPDTTGHGSVLSYSRLRQYPRLRTVFGVVVGSLVSALLIVGTNVINGIIIIAFVMSASGAAFVCEYLLFFATQSELEAAETWFLFQESPARLGVPCAGALVFIIPLRVTQVVASLLIIGFLLTVARGSRLAQAVAMMFALTPVAGVVDGVLSGTFPSPVAFLGWVVVTPWAALHVQKALSVDSNK